MCAHASHSCKNLEKPNVFTYESLVLFYIPLCLFRSWACAWLWVWLYLRHSNEIEPQWVFFPFLSLSSLSFSSVQFSSFPILTISVVVAFCFLLLLLLYWLPLILYYRAVLQSKREAETNAMRAQWVSFDFKWVFAQSWACRHSCAYALTMHSKNLYTSPANVNRFNWRSLVR